MADLTPLDEKLGEVLGLAQAAQDTAAKVAKMEGADDFKADLDRMAQEARETEQRTAQLVDSFEGRKTAIREKARETKTEAAEMAETYLSGEDEALDGFEFLTMAEAGEVGHWAVLAELNRKARNGEVRTLVTKHLPIQKRHLRDVQAGTQKLAREEDRLEAA